MYKVCILIWQIIMNTLEKKKKLQQTKTKAQLRPGRKIFLLFEVSSLGRNFFPRF